ncbi:MAG: diguanylate cyclase [Anaerolineales bacterium]
MDQATLIFTIRFSMAVAALILIGRLLFTAHAYLSWRAFAFFLIAALSAISWGVYRLAIGEPVSQNLTPGVLFNLGLFEMLFTFGLLASLGEHVMADRKRHKDSRKLLEQWRTASNLAQMRARELETLSSITRELARSLDLTEVLQAVVDYALSLSDADTVTVFVYNRDSGELTNPVTAAVGERLKTPLLPRPDGLTATVAQNGESAFVTDTHAQTLYMDDSGRGLRAIASLPLRLEGKVVGVMNVGYLQPHVFNDDEVRMLNALGDAAALAVHNAAMHERIARLAVTDELTGLVNRRRFLELVRQEVQRARRYERPLTLLMVDLDRLKHINDEYGHAAGDAMLRGVADCLRASVRETDRPARLGGDEFAVLLPETTREDALPIAERIRVNVEEFSTTVNGIVIRSTVSIGLVSRKAGELTDLPSFIRLADDALYKAKSEGRNTITTSDLAAPLPDQD